VREDGLPLDQWFNGLMERAKMPAKEVDVSEFPKPGSTVWAKYPHTNEFREAVLVNICGDEVEVKFMDDVPMATSLDKLQRI
jgi:hypothetical protein